MNVRKYKPSDRRAVEHIQFETGLIGDSMSKFLRDNRHWKTMIAPYLNDEPENIFVLEDKKVVGYILGSFHDHGSITSFIFSNLKYYVKSFFTPDRKYWGVQLGALERMLLGKSDEAKLKTPKGAHIHINLLPKARKSNWGSKLLKTFEEYAADQGQTRIYAIANWRKSYNSENFWKKNNYKVYSKVKTTLWKSLIKEDVYLVCYSKKI